MTVALKYIGSQRPYFELAVTGKQSSWAPGQIGEVPDADAPLLLGTGVFERDINELSRDQLAAVDALVSGAGRTVVVLRPGADSAAASFNTAAIQAALDAGGYVVTSVAGGGQAYINATLQIGSNTTLDNTGCELTALGAIGLLIETKAFAASPVTVTLAWSAGTTVSVTWTAHGRVVGDWVWLNRADQGQFCGVFRVQSVTDANTFVVRLRRLPTTSPTGTITARPADINVGIIGGRWNYNAAGGNTGTGSDLHTIMAAGVWNLTIKDICGLNTSKYLVCVGAVHKYTISNVGGNALASDTLKVYGPAFSGTISDVGAGGGTDDCISFQTREPAAFAQYDFCHGDVIGASVQTIRGSSNTGALLFYASPFGTIDGISVSAAGAILTASIPQCRIETLYTTGSSEVGTISIDGLVAEDQNSLVSLGNGSGTLLIRNLILTNPIIRSTGNIGRLVTLGGTAVSGTVTIIGGYMANHDQIVNTGTNAGTITINSYGLRTTGGFTGFRCGTAGVLNLNLYDPVMENNLSGGFVASAAGTGVINLRCTGAVSPSAPTFSLGAGSFLRLAGACNLQIDGTILDATVANHAPGASF